MKVTAFSRFSSHCNSLSAAASEGEGGGGRGGITMKKIRYYQFCHLAD